MSLPIPEADWDRVWDFLSAGKTGKVILHVHQGHVVAVNLDESWKIGGQKGGLDKPDLKA